MRGSVCQLLRCPRLMSEGVSDRCNQQRTDGTAWNERVEQVSPERCSQLRKELRERRKGERPWEQ